MTEKKYAKNVLPIKYSEGWGGVQRMTYMTGQQMGGMDLNFVVEIYDDKGNWPKGAHVHSHAEALVFFGYGEDFNYLGADMSLAMGKEYEVHRFSKPTVVAIPAEVPHCPLVREKVYDKFGHMHIACSDHYSSAGVKKEGETDGNQYSYLFHTMKIEEGKGGAEARQSALVEGARDLSGVPLTLSLSIHNRTGQLFPSQGSLIHPYDSVLVFFGRKTDEITYLGAEISIQLGEEHEEFTFDVPTVIWLPAGTPHFPITCNKCEHTYTMVQLGLSTRYEASWV